MTGEAGKSGVPGGFLPVNPDNIGMGLFRHREFKGQVFYLSGSLSARSPVSSAYRGRAWETMLNLISESKYQPFKPGLSDIIRQKVQLSGGILNILLWVLFFYIILTGPVCYMLLKRYNRLIYGFAVIPIAALLAFGITAMLTAGTRSQGGSDRQVAYLIMAPGYRFAAAESMMEVNFTRKSSFQIGSADTSGFIEEMEPFADSPGKITWGDQGMNIRDIVINPYNPASFRVRWFPELPGGIIIQLKYSEEKVSGFIENKTGLNLSGCHIFIGRRVTQAFLLPPGRYKVDLPLSPSQSQPSAMLDWLLSNIPADMPDTDKNDSRERNAAMVRVAESLYHNSREVPKLLSGWAVPGPAGAVTTVGKGRSHSQTLVLVNMKNEDRDVIFTMANKREGALP